MHIHGREIVVYAPHVPRKCFKLNFYRNENANIWMPNIPLVLDIRPSSLNALIEQDVCDLVVSHVFFRRWCPLASRVGRRCPVDDTAPFLGVVLVLVGPVDLAPSPLVCFLI